MALWGRISGWARDRALDWLFEGQKPMTTTLDAEEKQAQSLVVLAREYYDGQHDVKLTDRQKAFLELHGKTASFTVNHMPTIVDAAVERLQVIGFDVPGEGEADPLPSALLWEYWEANRMDAKATEAHRRAICDGEAFILVDWDERRDRPNYTLHPRFTDDLLSGGDGYGMWAAYPNDDPLQPMEYAVKQWVETGEEGKPVTRRTVYYPERIEKYALVRRKWEPVQDEGDNGTWPIPWTLDGEPLGIPVAHLMNPARTSVLKAAIPLQDILNKTWLDLLAGADTTAFRMIACLGFVPTTDGGPAKDDGSNLLEVMPGQMIASIKEPSKASITPIDPASLAPLLDLEDRIVLRLATITRTPVSRFHTTRAIAAAETIKQQDAPLLGRVRENQTLFGNGWEDLGRTGWRLGMKFGRRRVADPDLAIETQWARAEIRDELVHMQELQAKQALGVDSDTIWAEMGYQEDRRAQFASAQRVAAADQLREAARAMAARQAEDETEAEAEEEG